MLHEKIKLWTTSNRFNYYFIVFSFALVSIFKFLLFIISYRGGLSNDHSRLFMWSPLFFLLFVMLILVLIVALVNIILTICEAFKAKYINWAKLLFAALPMPIVIVLFLLNFTGDSFLAGYEIWLKKNVDVPAIRKWLVQLPPEYSERVFRDEEEMPEYIKSMSRYIPRIRLSNFEKEKRYAEFQWGTPFIDWGIVIGAEDMKTPKDEEVIEIYDGEWESRRPIQSGVYIFVRD